ncbi:hypothetical protein EBZ80_17720 [bacterium]|nr:hypothetical protein [bacterium]
MKPIVLAALAVAFLGSGCATSHSAKLVAPKGAEYFVSDGDHPENARLVAKMDSVDDYTLDGNSPRIKKRVKSRGASPSF